ncbi:hypothetical protein C8R45DRAFT_1041639 [Mycena sanguinolenta]|nr:hypothetical protein C8R45DRAFT_1041639 [Mycena sanguinolenta]
MPPLPALRKAARRLNPLALFRSWRVPDDGRHTLPMELWNTVLLHLDDDALFAVAAVCRPFNERATLILLVSNGVTREALEDGCFTVPARLLPALLRACFIPPLKGVAFEFEPLTTDADFAPWLRMLSILVARSIDMRSAELRFPGTMRPATQKVVSTRAVSALMARTRHVTLVTPERFYHCRTKKLEAAFAFSEENIPWDDPHPGVWTQSEQASKELRVMRYQSSLLRAFIPRRAPGYVTVVINQDEIEAIIDRNRYYGLNLDLVKHYLDPYTVVLSWPDPRKRLPSRLDAVFRLPPTLLPQLKTLSTSDPAMMLTPLLEETRNAPLHTISLEVPSSIWVSRILFELALRKLSERTDPIHLEMISTRSRVKLFAKGDLKISKSLNCVSSVTVHQSCLAECAPLVPWLAELPAVTSVLFSVRAGENVSEFIEAAKRILTLPRVDVQVL